MCEVLIRNMTYMLWKIWIVSKLVKMLCVLSNTHCNVTLCWHHVGTIRICVPGEARNSVRKDRKFAYKLTFKSFRTIFTDRLKVLDLLFNFSLILTSEEFEKGRYSTRFSPLPVGLNVCQPATGLKVINQNEILCDQWQSCLADNFYLSSIPDITHI